MNPFGGFPSVDQMGQWAFFQLQQYKFHAEESLRRGDYASAFAMYNTAVEHFNMCGPFLNVREELPKIFSNRSLVSSKMGDFGLALADAQQCIDMDPLWAKGYWRAAAAYKGLNNFYEALNILIQGYNVTLPQGDQENAITFLQELIVTITQLHRHQGNCDSLLAEHEELNPESLEADAQEKLLQRLASSHYWEGVSLLITGEHRGPRSSLDFSIPNVSAKYVSIACLFKDLSVPDLKRYGMRLAVALQKNGSPYQDIEEKFGAPALHIVLIKTLETGNDELIKLFFRNYLDTQEKKDAVDRYGYSALHAIVRFKSCSDVERNNLLLLCIQSGCSAFIFDETEKLPIDYCNRTDKCFESLSNIFNDSETVRRHVLELKEKGNTAKEKQQYEQALLFYSRAINLSTRCDKLYRDSAILYTNRCTVYTERNHLQEALKDAELAIEIDKTWMKGHWRKSQLLRRNGQNTEAFVAAMEGVNISEIANKDKCELVIESVKSFQYLSDFEKNERYGAFADAPVDFLPSVLQRLSKESEWLCIKHLVIGIDQNSEAKGIARNTDFSTIKYNTLFTLIIQQAVKEVSSWIVPLIVHITTNPEGSNNLTSFKEWEGDTPLHAAARFSLITGNTSMLLCMEKVPLEMIDQNGNSPLHSVVKVPNPSQFATFPEVVQKLLQMGVSPDLRDAKGKMAVDYVDKCRDSKVIQLLSEGIRERDNSLQPLVEQNEDTVCENKDKRDSKDDQNRLKSEDNKAAKVDLKPSLSDSQDMKNEEHHHSSKSLSKSSDKTEFNLHRNEGDRALKAKKLKPALESYKKAKNHMNAASNAEKVNLFCKISDCFLDLGQHLKVIEEAEQFKAFIEKSYQAKVRLGKSFAGLQRYKEAFFHFIDAYNLSNSLTNVNLDDLLFEIASAYAVCEEDGM
ncbi:stress-induced-phosphoprotein 1-like [Saccostrea cucullata]|uniref:stress-induced-phosphoprotein 1-like n=1 Tax=Saccostrea cuccullata TaxID=36930 RepID=UPI002ED585BD